jgi:hypothetical protein
VKVAYWPGCVSRGFTPELHGAMEAVAPLLDLELVELDRVIRGRWMIRCRVSRSRVDGCRRAVEHGRVTLPVGVPADGCMG